ISRGLHGFTRLKSASSVANFLGVYWPDGPGLSLCRIRLMAVATMEDLKISLPLYEGPLDLLLDLIRRQKLDIYDIPIAKITEQYLEYLHLMEQLNVDVASEFLVIAAQLIYIKSRMLLPPDPDATPEEQEDPR